MFAVSAVLMVVGQLSRWWWCPRGTDDCRPFGWLTLTAVSRNDSGCIAGMPSLVLPRPLGVVLSVPRTVSSPLLASAAGLISDAVCPTLLVVPLVSSAPDKEDDTDEAVSAADPPVVAGGDATAMLGDDVFNSRGPEGGHSAFSTQEGSNAACFSCVKMIAACVSNDSGCRGPQCMETKTQGCAIRLESQWCKYSCGQRRDGVKQYPILPIPPEIANNQHTHINDLLIQ